ncbi:MAG: hypothetical protein ACXV8X_01745 [Candidatus Angelobacter sp.]
MAQTLVNTLQCMFRVVKQQFPRAVVPELQGFLADHIGIHHAFILPVLCYGYIIFYALKGASAARTQPA